MKSYDLIIVGGGINGAGALREAARRGLKAALFEQGEIACCTSSASSQLIHGGIRYLEQGSLQLVYTGLKEREILLNTAPDLVKPLRFIFPDMPEIRAPWRIGIGLKLYNLLSMGSQLPKAGRFPIETLDDGHAPSLNRAFSYYDALTHDAKLTQANIDDAQKHQAAVFTQTAIVEANAQHGKWTVKTAKGDQYQASAVINATGPYADKFHRDILNLPSKAALMLIQGSHLVVEKWYHHDNAYILQQPDNRIVFIIPHRPGKLLIGTTDTPFSGDPIQAHITDEECEYLLTAVNRYFTHQLSKTDIIDTTCGVRPIAAHPGKPLHQQPRDALIIDESLNGARALSLYGGKLTTYRHYAKKMLDKLRTQFPQMRRSDTHQAILP